MKIASVRGRRGMVHSRYLTSRRGRRTGQHQLRCRDVPRRSRRDAVALVCGRRNRPQSIYVRVVRRRASIVRHVEIFASPFLDGRQYLGSKNGEVSFDDVLFQGNSKHV